MKLYNPFQISARLLPALHIADAWISLAGVDEHSSGRQQSTFYIDIGEEQYCIDDLLSGMQGYTSDVEPFEQLLAFMASCGESNRYADRTGNKGENWDLFVPELAQWCAEHEDEIEMMRSDITTDDGTVRHELLDS